MKRERLIRRIEKYLNVGVLTKFNSAKSGIIRGKLVTMLSLIKRGRSNSSYNTDDIITENGNTLTIRLADHPATESNFKSEKNISLVIGKKADDIVITTVKQSRIYSEIVYKSECFADDKRKQTMEEILKGLKAALQTGYYVKGKMGVYNVELNETTPLTPEFKRWFGDSKVVYKNGKPRVVYHGTNTEFDTFDVAKFGLWDNGTKWDFEENKPLKDKGFFFTAAKTTAKDHAEGAVDMAGGKPIVLDVYLRIEKPLIVQVDKFKAQRGYDSQQWFDMWTSKLLHQYEAGDYDGIIVNNPIDDNDKLFVVFSQNQIKSASRNSGAFSLESDSILEGLGSIREEAAPRKTITAYKLMRLVDGKLYPLYIDNSAPVELGVWYNADSPDFEILKTLPSGYCYLIDSNNRVIERTTRLLNDNQTKLRTSADVVAEIEAATAKQQRWIWIEKTNSAQRRFSGENRRYWNLGINGSGTPNHYSMRPGWHAGSLPTMLQVWCGSQNDKKTKDNFVFTECEISADIDYNPEAQRNPDKDLPDKMPVDGYYLKATNADKRAAQADRVGWFVAGAIKINRIISDSEAHAIIDRYNAQHPDDEPVQYQWPRESGKMFNADTMQLEGCLNGTNDFYALFSDDNDLLVDFGVGWNRRDVRRKAVEYMKEHNIQSAFIEITDCEGEIKDTIDIDLGLQGLGEPAAADEPQTDTLESKLAVLKKFFAAKQKAERATHSKEDAKYIKYAVRINAYPPEIGKSPIYAFKYPTGTAYSDVRFEQYSSGSNDWDYLSVAYVFDETKEVKVYCDALPEYKELIAKLKAAQPKKDEQTTEPAPEQPQPTADEPQDLTVEAILASGKTDLSDSEKEVLRRYQGNGGQGKRTTERGILDEYYTPDYVCEFMYQLAVRYGYTAGKVLEPSCATGNCLRPIYERNDYTHIDAFEINETSRKICRLLYPNATLYENYFETAFLEQPRFSTKAKKTWLPNAPYDLVIGNPPYGKHVNRFSSYFGGKDHFEQIEMFFMVKALELLRSGGLLVYITSTNFMSTGNKYQAVKDRIGEMADFVDAYRLPKVFAATDICTDIIVLRKK